MKTLACRQNAFLPAFAAIYRKIYGNFWRWFASCHIAYYSHLSHSQIIALNKYLVCPHTNFVKHFCHASPMEDFPYLSEAISRVLARLREDAHLNKSKLSRLTTIDRVYILQVEQGKYRPSVNFIFLIAQALGVSAGALISLVEQEQKKLAEESFMSQGT